MRIRIRKNILIMVVVATIVVSSFSTYFYFEQQKQQERRLEIYVGFDYNVNLTIVNFTGSFGELWSLIDNNWTISYGINQTHVIITAYIPSFKYTSEQVNVTFYNVKVWAFVNGENYFFPVSAPGNYTFYIFLFKERG